MIGPGVALLTGMKLNGLRMASKGQAAFSLGQTAFSKAAGAADKIIPKGSSNTMSGGLGDSGLSHVSKSNVPSQNNSSQVAAGKNIKLNPAAVAASMNKSPSQMSSAQGTTTGKIIPKTGAIKAQVSKGSAGILKS